MSLRGWLLRLGLFYLVHLGSLSSNSWYLRTYDFVLSSYSRSFYGKCPFFPTGCYWGCSRNCSFSYPVEFLLKHYQVVVLWGFAGAIVGTIPSLVSESTKHSKRDQVDIIWLVATFVVSGLGLYFLNDLVGTLPANFLTFILAGVLIALGVLVMGLAHPTCY